PAPAAMTPPPASSSTTKKSTTPPSTPTTTPTPPTTTPPTSVPRETGPRVSWDDATPAEQAGLLKRFCPKLACTVDLDARRAGWAKQDAHGMSRFRADLAACRKRCGRL
ncbi:MAG TPA: hypothetical protein VGF99_01870, partial [Myxococcota bacterium]